MTEQYRPNIGHVPDDTARRDAIHIAVAPLLAACDMQPGQIFKLDDRGYAIPSVHAHADDKLGIVDPYRFGTILAGTRFWGFLWPNTITNLRHVWEHPAFKAKIPGV